MATIWLVRAYTPPLSAPDSAVDRNYHFARALRGRGHDVVMITSAISRWEGQPGTSLEGKKYLDETADGLTVRVLSGRPYTTTLQRFWSMIHFERAALRSTAGLPPPDLVIGTTVDPFAADAGLRLARRHQVPFILELGDIWPRTLVDMGSLSRWNPIYWVLRALELRLYRKAIRILSKLPLGKNHVAASRSDPDKVVYLPNGVDITPFLAGDYPTAPAARDEFVVMYGGGMTPIYGLEHLIDAAHIVAVQYPDSPITFRLIGSGRSRTELMDYAAGLGLSNVEFPDPVPRTQVHTLLAEADVCVALARDIAVVREFGMSHNKVYEYLGAARPIVLSVAAANDPVAEARAGISVEPENSQAIADAIIELYQLTRQERIEMGGRGQAFAKAGYTMDTIGERLARVVDEVLLGLPAGTNVSVDDPMG